MKEKIETTKESIIDKSATITHTTITQDLKNSVLIVSVVTNMFIFTAWVALQATTQFDTQFANLLFNR